MEYVRLGDYCDITSSKRVFADQYVEEGVPFYRSREIIEKKEMNDISESLFITEELYELFRTKFGVPSEGDLLLTSVGTLGVPYIVKKEKFYFKDGNLTWMKNFKKELSSKYLYYWFNSKFGKESLVIRAIGSSQAALTIDILKKYKFFLPEIKIQNQIVKILSVYDDLIENNNKRIKILEQMAENLYKEWFVRFRNPDKIKVKIGKVGDLCSIKSGYVFNSEDWQDVGCKVVKIKDLDGSFVNLENLDCVPEKVAQKAKNFMLQMGDLTIAMTGATIGKIGLVNEDGLYANQRVGKFFVDKRYVPYLYCFFKQEHIIESIIVFSGSSSAQPNISGENLEKINMPYDKALIDKFSTLILPLFQQMINIVNQNQNLIKQRDKLLPRLMSGKLEVKEAQEKVVAFKPKKTFTEFKSAFAAAARKDGGLTEQDMEELYKAYCDDSRDE